MLYVKTYEQFLSFCESKLLNEWVHALLESTRNPFDVLGIPRDSDLDAAKSAFRILSKKYHPDKNPGDRAAEEMFKEISAAYEMIKHPGKNGRRIDEPFKNPDSPSESPREAAYRKEKEERKAKRDKDFGDRSARSKKDSDDIKARYEEDSKDKNSKAAADNLQKSEKLKDIKSRQDAQFIKIAMKELKNQCVSAWSGLQYWKFEDNDSSVYFTNQSSDYTLNVQVLSTKMVGFKPIFSFRVFVESSNTILKSDKELTGADALASEINILKKIYYDNEV